VIHERLFVVETDDKGELSLKEPILLGNYSPGETPENLPPVIGMPDVSTWLHENCLKGFLDEVRTERVAEMERAAEHVELSLTELLQKADDEIGRAAAEVESRVQGAEGRLAQAESRHAELLARRDRRRQEMERQRSLTLQGVERIASVLVLPHPAREAPEVRRLRPSVETEAIAMQIVMDHERARGCQVDDVHEKDLQNDHRSKAWGFKSRLPLALHQSQPFSPHPIGFNSNARTDQRWYRLAPICWPLII